MRIVSPCAYGASHCMLVYGEWRLSGLCPLGNCHLLWRELSHRWPHSAHIWSLRLQEKGNIKKNQPINGLYSILKKTKNKFRSWGTRTSRHHWTIFRCEQGFRSISLVFRGEHKWVFQGATGDGFHTKKQNKNKQNPNSWMVNSEAQICREFLLHLLIVHSTKKMVDKQPWKCYVWSPTVYTKFAWSIP